MVIQRSRPKRTLCWGANFEKNPNLSSGPDYFQLEHFLCPLCPDMSLKGNSKWLMIVIFPSIRHEKVVNSRTLRIACTRKYNSKYLLWRLGLIVRSLPIPSRRINITLCQHSNIDILAKSLNRTSMWAVIIAQKNSQSLAEIHRAPSLFPK